MTSLLIMHIPPGARCRAHNARTTVRLPIADGTGEKEVGYFSAVPADGMTAAHWSREDLGTSRSKRQLLENCGIVRAFEMRLIAASRV
jgi:hypothetical protein